MHLSSSDSLVGAENLAKHWILSCFFWLTAELALA